MVHVHRKLSLKAGCEVTFKNIASHPIDGKIRLKTCLSSPPIKTCAQNRCTGPTHAHRNPATIPKIGDLTSLIKTDIKTVYAAAKNKCFPVSFKIWFTQSSCYILLQVEVPSCSHLESDNPITFSS